MRFLRLALLGSLGAWVTLVIAGLLGVAFAPPYTTYSVTAQTDRIRFETEEAPASRWVLEDVEVLDADADSSFSFSGFFEPGPFIDVLVERIGLGPLVVEVSKLPIEAGDMDAPADPSPGSVGRLLSLNEEPFHRAGSRLYVFADSFPDRSRVGQTVLIPVSGSVTSGRETMIETNRTTSVLRSGSVAVLAETLFGLRAFEARRVPLGLGDQFVLEQSEEQSLGFLLVDERPSLSVAYRAVGSGARVDRAGGSSFQVDVSWFDRAVNDPLFHAVSLLLGLLAAVATLFMLFLTWHSTRGGGVDDHGTHRGPDVEPVDSADRDTPAPDPIGKASSDTRGVYSPLLVLALLATSQSLGAQQSVYVRAGEEGQGLLRARASSCFVVLPRHVVENAGGTVQVVGAQGLRSEGDVEMTYEIDLALVRLQNGGELTCTSWDGLPAIAPLLRSPGGYLLERGAQGVESRTPVQIQRVDEDYVTVRASEGQIRPGMSGSALVVEGVPIGLLLSVCANEQGETFCENGTAEVLRLDAVKRYTDGFFLVQDASLAVEQRNSQERAQQEVQDFIAEARRTQDSTMMAMRNGREPDLPTLKRDVEGLGLIAARAPPFSRLYPFSDDAQALQMFNQHFGTVPDYGDVELRVLHASLSLSGPILSSAPDLPPRVGECTLYGATGPVRDFQIPSRSTDPAQSVFYALAWGDTGETLQPGEYWIECTVDGEVFESARTTIRRPLRPWGEFAFDRGGVGRVEEVVLATPDTELVWELDPERGQWEVTVPASRQPDAVYTVRFSARQTSGESPEGVEVREVVCEASGVIGGPIRGIAPELVEPGVWRVSVPLQTSGRVRAGDRAYLSCGWRTGVAFFQVLLEFA